jgi:hypothetical protein
MLRTKILSLTHDMAKEFERCSHQYSHLYIASAWCGDPEYVLPFSHLDVLSGNIKATIGISFNQTHPDAINYLSNLNADLRIFRDQARLFHPKIKNTPGSGLKY